jgi:SAM-dependent methyltransferase
MTEKHGLWSIYIFALRYALLNVFRGRIRRGLYLLVRPIDYWRVREFPITVSYLAPQRGERILDIGSPKLLSAYLADRCGATVAALDVYDDKGLTDTLFFAHATRNERLHVLIGDGRNLPFPDATFDKVFSVSVLEHVSPPRGGDLLAMKEIARVLRPGGCLAATFPFSPSYFEEFRQGDIYDRKQGEPGGGVFYQRHHDAVTLNALLAGVPEFDVVKKEFICERIYRRQGRELTNLISEGNKFKRLSLAPFYIVFGLAFLSRKEAPRKGSHYMAVCLLLRKKAAGLMS